MSRPFSFHRIILARNRTKFPNTAVWLMHKFFLTKLASFCYSCYLSFKIVNISVFTDTRKGTEFAIASFYFG
ncbi:hypothetical protein A2165_00460 [Candidatus Curtissbacteria bacterium RBG_13_40_7]|uniref:Uncharacterized protein n=1 Tax=Candidatus Curtissbacteria bacterium RBG_13_40_7 TaxID=1797706 RepID=A0A1F5FVR2_9BACT|nr:MAG: hypothetical protein A2165_00460 [Candidatus Curtissbacteria bacterium RBG_13_40_7]